MIYVFLISTFLFLYNILIYPIILFIFSSFFKLKKLDVITVYPTVTVLCPAYNEEKSIKKKLESFINLNYPKDKIEMIVISDDSTDKTNEIVNEFVNKYKNIKLIIQKPRKGKVSGMNMVEPMINSEYVLSTDATSIFDKDAVINLVKIMLADKKVGFVAGHMKFPKKTQTSGEDTYFSMDSKIKYWESKIYSTITSNGVLFLIKRELFVKMHPTSPDDLERIFYTIRKGYKAKFTFEAFVYEEVEDKAIKEFNRKQRIISTGWAALFRQIDVLNPFKHPIPAFFIFSHKIVKWLIGFFAIIMYISSAFLVKEYSIFKWIFIIENMILILGIIELLLQSKSKTSKIGKFPAYFILMNLASIVGFYKFITGKYSGVWETNR